MENTDRIQVRKGEVYIAIRQIEVVNIIKQRDVYKRQTGKWYDYLTGDEVEVKDTTQKMEIPAHSYRIPVSYTHLDVYKRQ